jgi:signal transduction histidine kinase
MMSGGGKARILIVEDDLCVAQLQCRRLESAGYEVVVVATAPEALECARSGQVDLAILDYCLRGGITGLNLFEQFKSADLRLPVIIVTAFSEEGTIIKALRAGVSDFVPKTAAYLDYLPDAIARVLKQVRVEKKLAESEEGLRKRDEQSRHAQKMQALGTLAGGVAHEFNNLLQSMRGYTQYAIDGLDANDRRRQDLEVVLKATERAETLTRQLLGFGRRQMLQFADLDPNQVVSDSVCMLRPLIEAHINLELSLGEDVGTVHADPTHLQQLVMNLCVNARDAMPDGGQLLIKTERILLDDETCAAYPDLAPGNYLALTVSDTGCGMSSEVLQQAFDPFYTTKEVGKGTGLGLATIYGVVAQHKGTVRVYSEPGVGTAFKILLPTVNRLARPSAKPTAVGQAQPGETILVAEDEPLVRELAVRALTAAGYRTLDAADGAEALSLFAAQPCEISLVLLDVVMPCMNGHEVYEQMRLLKGDVKIIFTSAYDVETARLGFIDRQGLRFLHKPFDGADLLPMVREVLDCQGAEVAEAV